MPNPASVSLVANMIQSAITPVFLIAGIGSILNVIAVRLSRAVDRGRELVANGNHDEAVTAEEMVIIDRRIALANTATTFCVASALCVCLVVTLVFLNPLTEIDFGEAAGIVFILAMVLLGGGLIAFLAEIRVALKAPRIIPKNRRPN